MHLGGVVFVGCNLEIAVSGSAEVGLVGGLETHRMVDVDDVVGHVLQRAVDVTMLVGVEVSSELVFVAAHIKPFVGSPMPGRMVVRRCECCMCGSFIVIWATASSRPAFL